ncbi:permease [Alteribacter natronophilus]|uniref:permease n=1 Tax=Alteribacter natronophilus TaxID=2583810 RepID=UPI00110E043B|nr:permease [Alteribacter natronophilus]TMW73691.1 permease [Alteribacter natronophilus]
MKPQQVRAFGKDLIGMGLLLLFLILFLFSDRLSESRYIQDLPAAWVNVNTLFLSIVIEAIPFILLGVFVSALIQIYISEETIRRYLPKNALGALFPAAVLGAIFPLCECAIVPVVARLVKKGMPLHVGVVFLVAAPILNPIVFASTFFAFGSSWTHPVLLTRMGLAFILSIIIGFVLFLLFRHTRQLRSQASSLTDHDHLHSHSHSHDEKPGVMQRIKDTVYHAVDEFFLMGKYLILGAFIASLFQTFLNRELLTTIGANEYSSTAVMMGFAYLLSLCSEADAFVAASFTQFSAGSLIAFLVYGPMLDLKNTFMLFAYFRPKFVIAFMVTVTITVFTAILIVNRFLLPNWYMWF